jgi:hypothetical protein
MKYIILLLTLTGCAAGSSWNASLGNPSKDGAPAPSVNGTQTLVLDRQVQGMSRNEVIMAVNECEGSGLRAVVLTTKRYINGFSSDVIFEVTCAPKYKNF